MSLQVGEQQVVHFHGDEGVFGRAGGTTFFPLSGDWLGKDLPEPGAVWLVEVRFDPRQARGIRYCVPVEFKGVYEDGGQKQASPRDELERLRNTTYRSSFVRDSRGVHCIVAEDVRGVPGRNWTGPWPEAGETHTVRVVAISRDGSYVYLVPE